MHSVKVLKLSNVNGNQNVAFYVVFATNLEHIKRIGTINALLGSQIDMEKKTFLHSTANYFAGKVS